MAESIAPPGQTPTGELGTRLVPDHWPEANSATQHMQANRLITAQSNPANIRHDLLVEKSVVGKLIGKASGAPTRPRGPSSPGCTTPPPAAQLQPPTRARRAAVNSGSSRRRAVRR